MVDRAQFDSGLANVVVAETEICLVDGRAGLYRYRGFDVRDIAHDASFAEVVALLFLGDRGGDISAMGVAWSAVEELARDVAALNPRRDLNLLQLLALAAWLSDRPRARTNDHSMGDERVRAVRTCLLVGLAAALVHSGRSASPARGSDDRVVLEEYVAQLAAILTDGSADATSVAALERYAIVTCENGLNASTFVARIVASTGAELGASLAAACGALAGPKHGGAPEVVLGQLHSVDGLADVDSYVAATFQSARRLSGFGHREYTKVDPRAELLREVAHEIAPSQALKADAMADAVREYRKAEGKGPLAPNMELYAAVVLEGVGVSGPTMPGVFGTVRTFGWACHALEQARTGRMVRPTARFVGSVERARR